MKKLFKTLLIIFLSLFILIIGAAITVPLIFKDRIFFEAKKEINNNLNAKVDFGDLDLSLIRSFPDLTLTMENLSIVGIEEFEGDTLSYFKKLSLTVDLMSVINGEQYKIEEIYLGGARILAKVLKDGKANWDIAKESDTPEEATVEEESGPFKMTLKSFEIENSRIEYDDASLSFYMLMDGMDHKLSGDFTEDLFTIETITEITKMTMLYEGIPYFNKVNTKIKMDMDADMPNFKFTFKENEFQLNQLFLKMDGYFAMPAEDMDMDIQFAALKTDFKNILSLVPAVYATDFESVKTSGKLALDGFVKGIYSETKMPAFNLKLLVENGMFQYPDLPKSVDNINVDVVVDNKTGDPDATVVDINKFHIEMAANPLDVKMHITKPESDPTIDGTIKGKIDLATVKDIMPMEEGEKMSGIISADITLKGSMSAIDEERYSDFHAAGNMNIQAMEYQTPDVPTTFIKNMMLNFSPQCLELAAFDANIGKSDIQANGRIDNFMQYYFKEELLKGNFNMNSTTMDLNEFMTEEEVEVAEDAPAEEPMEVVEVPKNISFALSSSIKNLIYDNMEMKDVSGMIIIHEGKVAMKNLKMNLLGGSMLVNGTYSTENPKKPKVDFSLGINNFDIEQTVATFNTVEKLAPMAKTAKGNFSTNMSFNSDLDDKMEPMMSSLNGSGSLQTGKVAIDGFGPINKLAETLKIDKLKRMDFNDLLVKFKFENGRVEIEPFDFKTGFGSGQFGGSNGFDQSIDYVMALDIPRSMFGGAANGVLNNMVSQVNSKGANFTAGETIAVAALLGGTVLDPKVRTQIKTQAGDIKESLKAMAQEKKEEVVQQAKEQVKAQVDNAKEKASAEAEKIIRDAQVQADKIKSEARNAADKVKKEGYANADKLEKEAKGPVAKAAAKKGADKLRKEADAKANSIIREADAKADGVMNEARAKADKLK